MARPYKIVPLETIATDGQGNIVEFNISAQVIPVPGNTPESYRSAIKYCQQTAVALNAQGSPEAAWWLAQAAAFEAEMAEKFGHALAKQAKGETPAPTIWFHAERQYSIDRVTPLKVSEEFDNILQAFLGSQAAMETSEIELKSGVTNVSRAMQALAAWNEGIFEPAVRIPSGKAKGGYFVHVSNL